MTRHVLLVVHTDRSRSIAGARVIASRLLAAGITVRVLAEEAAAVAEPSAATASAAMASVVPVPQAHAAEGCDLVVVLGGDGTLLRAAEIARPSGAALLGVNVGRVGFLAETEPEQLDATVDKIIKGTYVVEDRMTLETVTEYPDGTEIAGWALNEAAIERDEPSRMIEVAVEVDGRPLSVWGCDGVLCATPTGSTAYAFSAGGPVVWPEVAALLLVPNNAHALFNRAMVVAPTSLVTMTVLSRSVPAILCHDGRRTIAVPSGSRIHARRSDVPVRVARTHPGPFTDRLVAKFDLPVRGWRGRPSE